MQRVISLLPEAAIIIDRSGLIVAVNKHVCSMFEYEPNELIGQKIELLVPEDRREKHQKNRQTYSIKEIHETVPVYGQRKSGDVFRADVSMGELDDEYVLVIVRDIDVIVHIYERLQKLMDKVEHIRDLL